MHTTPSPDTWLTREAPDTIPSPPNAVQRSDAQYALAVRCWTQAEGLRAEGRQAGHEAARLAGKARDNLLMGNDDGAMQMLRRAAEQRHEMRRLLREATDATRRGDTFAHYASRALEEEWAEHAEAAQ